MACQGPPADPPAGFNALRASSFPPLVAAEGRSLRKQVSGLHPDNLHNLWLSFDSEVRGRYFHIFSVGEKFLAALPPCLWQGAGLRGRKTA
jgi:hypothetical protein